MSGSRKPSNQGLRTREALLQAAGRLMQQGRKPTMDEVAAEALAPARHRFRDASYPRARLPGGAVGNAPASRAR